MSATPQSPEFADLPTLGIIYDLHPITFRRAISAGELRGYKFGPRKGIRVRLSDAAQWAESKRVPNARSTRERVVS